jgi:hypothetical protein
MVAEAVIAAEAEEFVSANFANNRVVLFRAIEPNLHQLPELLPVVGSTTATWPIPEA